MFSKNPSIFELDNNEKEINNMNKDLNLIFS